MKKFVTAVIVTVVVAIAGLVGYNKYSTSVNTEVVTDSVTVDSVAVDTTIVEFSQVDSVAVDTLTISE